MAIWAALIVVSTVFVKHHYIADVVAGVLLAFLVSCVSLRLMADRRGAP